MWLSKWIKAWKLWKNARRKLKMCIEMSEARKCVGKPCMECKYHFTQEEMK